MARPNTQDETDGYTEPDGWNIRDAIGVAIIVGLIFWQLAAYAGLLPNETGAALRAMGAV